MPHTTTRILVINPNITTAITDSFHRAIDSLKLSNTEVSYWTNSGGTGPATLSTDAEIEESARQCLEPLLKITDDYDGFYIAAYTLHPLVPLLQEKAGGKPVVGMFQGSVTTALHLLPSGSKFAIVTTTHGFIKHLDDAVAVMLGISSGQTSLYAGTIASGVTWDILVTGPQDTARNMIIEAVRKSIRDSQVKVVCLGGAILHDMKAWAHEACDMELGDEAGRSITIVDPLLPGVVTLEALLRLHNIESKSERRC